MTNLGGRALDRVGELTDRMLDGNLRIGVTGLRRSGKTVLTTALIDNLLHADRLPFLDVVATGRFIAARMEPQPDQAVPRFDFESQMERLTAPDPRWPNNTKVTSQARVALRYMPGTLLRRRLRGASRLTLDIVDYPGEWLLDLPLLDRTYAEWSRETLELSRRPPRDRLAAEWLAYLSNRDPAGPAEEAVARRAAELYTTYLLACRASDQLLSLIQPGRFVEPGELVGAPVLAFCPLLEPPARAGRHTLWAMMEERFEAYKTNVVRRFFSEHFARLDRQIVLVDVLGALNAGPAALADMRTSLSATLESFSHGRSSWLDRLLGGRIDRVLFAATKADHIPSNQHANLRRLLDGLVEERRNAIRFEGARVETMAIAALKCTETVMAEHQGRQLACVRGIPLGRTEPTVLYPGEIPDDHRLLDQDGARRLNFLNFRPPALTARQGRGLPNIRLDQALEFLIGDFLT
ncbi:ATP/GTP-binding protein [Skermanella stibiiresistens SB22]|uniref:ATP/GTP-binding protein n=1 Tax=Skermanella stibiiresistens SB22 TaxID=1385369 RepID=W9GW76_9PROT|nr:ATP/GTP-binding protein [Skermanella stibiiresistens SB22]